MVYLNVNKRKTQLIACTVVTNWRIWTLRIWLGSQKHFCAEAGWLTETRSLDQMQTGLQLGNDSHRNSLLREYGNRGRWSRCCCVLSAGESGVLLTANSHSKCGCRCAGGPRSCCYTICPSRVHPTGVLRQTVCTREVNVSKENLNTTITLLFSIQISMRFSSYS